MIPNKLLWLVLSTLNLYPSRSTGPQFKFFKIYLLQVWTRFAIFGEIHSFPFPKILRKFRQSLDASRGHLTKFQLKKIFPHAPNISWNSWCALFPFKFRVSVLSFSRQCRFLQSLASISPVLALASCSMFPLLIQCAARLFGRLRASMATCHVNSGASRDGRTARGGQQGQALQYGAVQHRPHH